MDDDEYRFAVYVPKRVMNALCDLVDAETIRLARLKSPRKKQREQLALMQAAAKGLNESWNDPQITEKGR